MKLKIYIDSGANHDSANEHEIDVEDFGFTSSEWKNLTEEERFQQVVEYWQGMGYPEIGYEEQSE